MMFKIAHLSDFHLTAARRPLYATVNPWSRVERALQAAGQQQPDLLVVTGDVCDRTAPDYAAVERLLRQAVTRTRKPLLLLPGNHDVPDAMPAPILGCEFLPTPNEISYGVCPGDIAITTSQWQVVGLNSHGQDTAAGQLFAAQLEWLQTVLHPSKPALLALHHPPTQHPLPELRDIGLADAAELTGVIAARREPTALHTVGIICGHFHFPWQAKLTAGSRSIPVWVAPSVAYGIDPQATPGTLRAIDHTGYQMLHGDSRQLLPQLHTITQTATEIYRKPLTTQEKA